METQLTKKSSRLDVVDALRGFALLAIILFHNLEHFNLFHPAQWQPAWLNIIDKGVWEASVFTFAGKAYATFSLLFGFSFYIQYANAAKRGEDFRARFAWRLLMLVCFSQLHALFYNGDILLLYAVVGMVLIPTSRLSDRTVLTIAIICLLQPLEWIRMIVGSFDSSLTFYGSYFWIYGSRTLEPLTNGSLLDALKSNITDGQIYCNLWQVENGRLFQSASLFMFGMLAARNGLFADSEKSSAFWKKVLIYGAIAFVPLFIIKTFVPALITNNAVKQPFEILFPSLSNFALMIVLVSSFCLIWFRSGGRSWQRFIIPFGRMSLTNYITQSIIGVTIYYGFGLSLYKYTGATLSLLIGLSIFSLQLYLSRKWLATHSQGPLEFLWKKATWISFGPKVVSEKA